MPPLVPTLWPQYFVLCDYGPKLGKAWYEADPERSDRDTIIDWLIEGQYTNPVQIIEVDVTAGTSRDVSAELAEEIRFRVGNLVAVESADFVTA